MICLIYKFLLYNSQMNELVKNLTQKDEHKALLAAKTLIETKDVNSFKELCEKSDFLFDFIKNNVRKRIKSVINEHNYKNIPVFFGLYNEDYAEILIEAMARYADEDMSDEMFELLENGTLDQKKYAAKYFCFIPDTIAQEQLEKYAFENDIELAVNSAAALGAMNERTTFEKALQNIKSEDEFELIKAVRFLTAYGDKTAIAPLLASLKTASTAENIAGEITCLMPVSEMLETQNEDEVLTCISFILLGLGEVLPLCDIFSYEIFEVLQLIIQKAQLKQSGHVACILLQALEKFSTFESNDEYVFDESKDVKNEIKEIYNLLTSQPKAFWKQQEELISGELLNEKTRVAAALEVIRSLDIKRAQDDLIGFINSSNDEQLIILALSTAKVLGIIKKLDVEKLSQKISNQTLKAVLMSYFI